MYVFLFCIGYYQKTKMHPVFLVCLILMSYNGTILYVSSLGPNEL